MHILVVMRRKTRYPELPNVPTARELAKSDNDRALIEVLELPYAMSRPFAAPPGVPKDRADALVKAFMETHKDPEYLKDAEKLNIDVSPIDGDDVRSRIESIAQGAARCHEGRRKADHLQLILEQRASLPLSGGGEFFHALRTDASRARLFERPLPRVANRVKYQ